jgi:hypothetical protein
VHKRPKPWPAHRNLLCKTVGKDPTAFKGIQVRGRGSSYAQVCTQFIQGNIPLDPDRLCAWDEKIGITGGRPELSTWLSPPVDNLRNRCKIKQLQFIFMATIRCFPGHATTRRACKNKALPLPRGACDGYRVPKDDWKINAVSARIGARWVSIPLQHTTLHRASEEKRNGARESEQRCQEAPTAEADEQARTQPARPRT